VRPPNRPNETRGDAASRRQVGFRALKRDGSPSWRSLWRTYEISSASVSNSYLEPILEPVFHTDSYGYRPGKSAIDAVRQARERCWRYDWVLDIDVKGYFDSIDWELLLSAVRRHTNCPWVLLYIERWLKVPVQMEDGSVVPRTAGTPQGGVVSPLLANLFLHYAFDMWMARTYPHIPFERYADDAICHCQSADEAQEVWSALADRFVACKLVLHPVKTKIVYCKDAKRRGDFPTPSYGLPLARRLHVGADRGRAAAASDGAAWNPASGGDRVHRARGGSVSSYRAPGSLSRPFMREAVGCSRLSLLTRYSMRFRV
jgi:hypothetical protein